MKKASLQKQDVPKLPTGIRGLDDILRRGLARQRNTLIMGGPGSGKTVLTLQTLVNGARDFNEPGIFVAFEETSTLILLHPSQPRRVIGSLSEREKVLGTLGL